jgi:ankyrin repeat protein
MPANAVELARVLLDAGAEPDAPCGGGPAQPETSGGTTLGLVMSSRQAVETQQAASLIDLLIERGAQAGIADGSLLWLALYHVVECRRQREAAEHLRRRHGAPVDLACAAGLGELGTVSGFYGKGGALDFGAASLWRARKRGAGRDDPPPRPGEILAEALAIAAANGRDEVVTYLLERGVPTDIWTTYGTFRITPLHCAAWAGWPETCRLFLDRGADAAMREPTHGGTPLGWAEHRGHQETMAVFLERPERLDVVDLLEHAADDALRERLADLDPDMPFPHHKPGVLLRLAAWFGRTEAVRQLLARGADPKLAASDGKTALDVARERGHDEVAALLV